MPVPSVTFVLVEPKEGANVGAAARALANLGFDRLVLVRPACDPQGEAARRLARDGARVLEAARLVDDLDAALDGAATVVGTSRRTGKHRRPHYRLDELASRAASLAAAGTLAVLFGREDHGLTDAELDRCTHLVHFSADESCPSFNLAQSVLLVAWELRLALLEGPPDAVLPPPAPHAEREAMYRHLDRALRAIGFLHEDSAAPIMRRLRRLLGRAQMTAEEVKLLRGIARQTLWLARQAGIELPAERTSADETSPAARGAAAASRVDRRRR